MSATTFSTYDRLGIAPRSRYEPRLARVKVVDHSVQAARRHTISQLAVDARVPHDATAFCVHMTDTLGISRYALTRVLNRCL